MNSHLVSIIIPTYNRANLIGETLDSVLAQTYQNWECIIVDDGSNDNTGEVVGEYLKKDSRFKYYHRPEEHLPGGNGARNYGFKMSQGEFVNWFDSDDIMHRDKLKIQINDLVKYSLDVSFSGFQTLNKNGEIIIDQLSISKINIDLFEAIVTKKFKANTLTPIFNKKFLIEKKLFDEKLKTAHELDFYTSIFINKEVKFKINPNILNTVRMSSPNSIISKQNSQSLTIIKSLLKVRRRIQLKSNTFLEPEKLRKVTLIYLKLLRNLSKRKSYKKIVKSELSFLICNSKRYNFFQIVVYMLRHKLLH